MRVVEGILRRVYNNFNIYKIITLKNILNNIKTKRLIFWDHICFFLCLFWNRIVCIYVRVNIFILFFIKYNETFFICFSLPISVFHISLMFTDKTRVTKDNIFTIVIYFPPGKWHNLPVCNFSSAVFLVIHQKTSACIRHINNKFFCFIDHKFNTVSEMKILYKITRPFRFDNLLFIALTFAYIHIIL